MVVVGGKQPWLDDSNQIADFLAQGMGVFDLSALEWKDQYDAVAAPYVTPDVVKAWYNEHGRYPASWSNATVEAWFLPMSQSASNSKLPAIAGGVVGAVLGCLLLGTLAWCGLRRRSNKAEGRFMLRRRSDKLDATSEAKYYKPELDSIGPVGHDYKTTPVELSGRIAYPDKGTPAELDVRRLPMEKDGRKVHEVPESPRYELP